MSNLQAAYSQLTPSVALFQAAYVHDMIDAEQFESFVERCLAGESFSVSELRRAGMAQLVP
jgi:hypothetical protein